MAPVMAEANGGHFRDGRTIMACQHGEEKERKHEGQQLENEEANGGRVAGREARGECHARGLLRAAGAAANAQIYGFLHQSGPRAPYIPTRSGNSGVILMRSLRMSFCHSVS